MTPFTVLDGVMASLPVANINTDAIIPSTWLRSVSADFGRGLFGGLRYDAAGQERPDFVLNRMPYRQARILLTKENFGCGSSREAAVWALVQFGIRCVLAPSFADIFRENAYRNGLLAAEVDPAAMAHLAGLAQGMGGRQPNAVFHVDLAARCVTGPDGVAHPIAVPAARAEALLRGEDEIAATLRLRPQVDAFLQHGRAREPWLYDMPANGDQP